MTEDERQYILQAEKDRQRSTRLVGIILCLCVILYLAVFGIPRGASQSDFFIAASVCGMFILYGLKMIFSSFSKAEPAEIEIIEGTFQIKYRRRQQQSFIGTTAVILPPMWTTFFKTGQHVIGSVSRVGKSVYLLRSDPMPENAIGKTLTELYEEQKTITKAGNKTFLRIVLTIAVIAASVYGIFKALPLFFGKSAMQKIGQFATDHPAVLEAVFKFLNNGGIFILPAAVIFAVIIFSSRKSLTAAKKQTDDGQSYIDPQSWLREYTDFFRTKGRTLFMPADKNEQYTEQLENAERMKLFSAEYKTICRQLSGDERKRFINDFNEIRKQLLQEMRTT